MVVVQWLRRWLPTRERSGVQLPAEPLSGNDLEQVVHTHVCKAVTGLATFSARIVIYLMLIRRAGT